MIRPVSIRTLAVRTSAWDTVASVEKSKLKTMVKAHTAVVEQIDSNYESDFVSDVEEAAASLSEVGVAGSSLQKGGGGSSGGGHKRKLKGPNPEHPTWGGKRLSTGKLDALNNMGERKGTFVYIPDAVRAVLDARVQQLSELGEKASLGHAVASFTHPDLFSVGAGTAPAQPEECQLCGFEPCGRRASAQAQPDQLALWKACRVVSNKVNHSQKKWRVLWHLCADIPGWL